jgi:predicted ester cyclase
MYYIYINYSITVLITEVKVTKVYLKTITNKEQKMSTAQNQAAFRQIIEEAFNKGNYQVLRTYVNPAFIEHQFGLHPTLEGMQGDIQYLRTAFPDFTLTIEDMVMEDGKVWARMTARGTNRGGFMGPPNGKSFQIAVFDVARFEDGKLIEHWGSPDRFHLLAQLDLLPKPTINR